jgi:hypothetical protein
MPTTTTAKHCVYDTINPDQDSRIPGKAIAMLFDTIADLAQDQFAVTQFIEQTIERFDDHPCEVYTAAVTYLRNELLNWK